MSDAGGDGPKCADQRPVFREPLSEDVVEQLIIESALRHGMRSLTDSELAALRGER